jgi:dsRNA-specific ribonuclease
MAFNSNDPLGLNSLMSEPGPSKPTTDTPPQPKPSNTRKVLVNKKWKRATLKPEDIKSLAISRHPRETAKRLAKAFDLPTPKWKKTKDDTKGEVVITTIISGLNIIATGRATTTNNAERESAKNVVKEYSFKLKTPQQVIDSLFDD